ncbi:MAG: ABC transporter ATP-binding protein [Candidatus Accumulibacter phosphatis]|jgi:ABC-type polysaccharide/polyol phosphate transport system ATPase subunit|uniref:Teichoic acids export ATP-binding protein TagH n=1 Tax=Candidatus Accumulibacter phosphatis TaxID=327160 RepID=A0A080LZU4_9PROT|nr:MULTISPECIES: ABC transporter ATP-binding protein [Candidatus Accumulibacter]KFB74463.1 MAG: Teichoic acids export ATP-binding protein TagH [Candidatus Accumulibacter phosphatis]
MSSEPVISVRGLSKTYRVYDHPLHGLLSRLSGDRIGRRKEYRALEDLSFDVGHGETVGIIGRNGSGKSTLLQLICGIRKATVGSVRTHGRVSALLELGSGFHPEFTGRENVFLQGAIAGFSRPEMESRFDHIVAFADIGEFIDQPVRLYSSGMFVRLAFAVSVEVAPDILVIDEALSVGDIDFQAKCLTRMRELMANGVTTLFVSHSMQAVNAYCTRALLLEDGRLRFDGSPEQAVDLHRGQFAMATRIDLRKPQSGRRGLRHCIELLELAVKNMSGEPCSNFAMGEQMHIRLHLRCSEPVPEARFGVLLTNSADSLIHDFASGFADIVGLDEGSHAFEIITGPLMVYPGTYYLGAWGQRALGIPSDDYVRAALSITIVDRGQVGGREAKFDIISKANSEVYLPCRWRKLA